MTIFVNQFIRSVLRNPPEWHKIIYDTKYNIWCSNSRHIIHFMSCRVHVVFHSFKFPWAPKLECKVEWHGWHQLNENIVCAQHKETILESIMNVVEKTYMIVYIYTLTTTSCEFFHLNSYCEYDMTMFVTCNCLLEETFHHWNVYGC